jgi:hypothetical protein
MRTEQDFWVEMSIREIWTQSHFAEISYGNIGTKGALGVDLVFSSIHSFLSHCAMISKMIKSEHGDRVILGKILSVSDNSPIHDRTSRNHLEHYDDRLQKWIRAKGLDATIGSYNIGPKSALDIPNMVLVSHFDPSTNIFTFVDEDFDLAILFTETQSIKSNANKWVKSLEVGIIKPPFV